MPKLRRVASPLPSFDTGQDPASASESSMNSALRYRFFFFALTLRARSRTGPTASLFDDNIDDGSDFSGAVPSPLNWTRLLPLTRCGSLVHPQRTDSLASVWIARTETRKTTAESRTLWWRGSLGVERA